MKTLRPFLSRKTPTIGRRICFALLGLLLLPRLASAQPADAQLTSPLSEADVIQLAKTRSPGGVVASATDRAAQARTRTAGLLPNPNVTWGRETIQTGPMNGQGSQDIVTATVPIDIARPLTSRSLVASEGAWMRAEAALSRTDAILAAVLAYYDVVFAKRRVEVLSQSVSNLKEAARVLARREAAGSASGYESSRLAIARELSRSHLAEAQGAHQSAKARLAALLGISITSLQVNTQLSLIASSDEAALERSGGSARPVMRQTRESLRLAKEAERRAEWVWLPALELGGGFKRANNAGYASGYGYVLGASLSIPLMDHGQAQRQAAEAQRALAAARSQALTRTINADVQSSLALYRTAHQELQRFEAQTTNQVEVMLSAAQSGYREGERSIVELLDAQRAQTDVAQRRLNLLDMTKRAEVRLRAAAGVL